VRLTPVAKLWWARQSLSAVGNSSWTVIGEEMAARGQAGRVGWGQALLVGGGGC
jgi:hypothetical protein